MSLRRREEDWRAREILPTNQFTGKFSKYCMSKKSCYVVVYSMKWVKTSWTYGIAVLITSTTIKLNKRCK